MHTPKISVIIPCYNAAFFLKQALDSVCNQTYGNLEIILVNDGSSDNTEEIIASYPDQRIKYIRQENKGQSAASNRGLSAATGDYVKFFDADDIMNPEHLEVQLRALHGSNDKLVACNWGRFEMNASYHSAQFNNWQYWEESDPLVWLKKELNQEDYMLGDMLAGWLWLIPRKLIEQAGGWDERLSLNNDFEFSIRLLLQSAAVLFAPEAKMYYRSGNTNSLNFSKSLQSYEAAYLSTKLGCTYLLQRDNSKEMRQICANRYELWITRIYPLFPSLLAKLEEETAALGGGNLKVRSGRIFNVIAATLGWRSALFCKHHINKLLNR